LAGGNVPKQHEGATSGRDGRAPGTAPYVPRYWRSALLSLSHRDSQLLGSFGG
jgi:hypothetical protein